MAKIYEGRLEGKSRGQIIDPANPDNAKIMAGTMQGSVTYVEADIDVGVKVFAKSVQKAEALLAAWNKSTETDANLRVNTAQLQEFEQSKTAKLLLADHSDTMAAKLFDKKTDKLAAVLLDRLNARKGEK